MRFDKPGATSRRLASASAVLVLLLGAAIAEASGKTVKVKAGTYSGMNSEHSPVSFKIVGRTINGFATQVGYNGSCGQGGGPGYQIRVKRTAIAKNGTFSTKITLVGPVKSVKNQKGMLSGKVSGGKVSGKIVDLTVEHGTGFCQKGYNETFSAARTHA